MQDLTPLYYERMAHSMGDKSKLLEWVIESKTDTTTILDVGGADGALAEHLEATIPSASVYVMEPIHDAAETARSKGLKVVEAWANELHENFENGTVDTVIASSLIHEVFSYGDTPGKIKNVREFLESAYTVLKPDGRLLIRDGVNPGDARDTITFREDFKNEGKKLLENFLNASPFAGENGSDKDRHINLTMDENGVIAGTRSSLMEFAYTITWGPGSFNREVQEFYGVFTLPELNGLANEIGFTTIHSESYLQPGYPLHLDYLEFGGGFPDSNAIWVLEKIS